MEETNGAVVDEPNQAESNKPVMSEPNEPQKAQPAEPDATRLPEAGSAAPPPAKPDGIISRPGEAPTPDPQWKGYAEVLKTYLREEGYVDYARLDRRRLELRPLLIELDELDPNVYQGWSRDEKLAFWINAYNLKMLEIIARNYPIQSSWWLRLTWPPSDIRHIKGIWTDYKFIVMDEEFTLAEVERRLFQSFGDPRVYLAVTYAARSGPPLRPEPYRGANLDRQLNEQVRRFLASPLGVRIDRRNMTVHLSALFKPAWRGKEFLGRYGTDKKFKSREPETQAVLNFLTGYLSREDVFFLEVENYAIEYVNFDWRLNDASGGY